jgi:3',5'-cyclic AMP phosphodiesterase CpdA
VSRVVVHLSDLHFGRVDPATLEPLVDAVRGIGPHVVAVSGDLTQRARKVEFEQARAFLDRLPAPVIAVPGNHDVPLYDVYGRFIEKLSLFHRYITPDTEPEYIDRRIAVIGLNTARAFTWKGGRINVQQMMHLRERLRRLRPDVFRIVVTHHPFELPEEQSRLDVVGRARMARAWLEESGADLLLSGHLHTCRYHGQSALLVQAGTAVSTRGRGEPNSFNCLRLDWPTVVVERWDWRGDRFERCAVHRYERREGRWITAA